MEIQKVVPLKRIKLQRRRNCSKPKESWPQLSHECLTAQKSIEKLLVVN